MTSYGPLPITTAIRKVSKAETLKIREGFVIPYRGLSNDVGRGGGGEGVRTHFDYCRY